MKAAGLLSPLLRSDTQGRILAWLALRPDSESSVSELANRAGVSVPTALREVERLTDSGIAIDRRVGATRLVSYNEGHPIARPLREILAYGYGPATVLPGLLATVPGVKQAFIYGSWAARNAGEPGSDPNDIDVLVVGDVDRGALYDAATEATRIVGREVNMNPISAKRWADGEDGFVRTVKSRPLVSLVDVDPS